MNFHENPFYGFALFRAEKVTDRTSLVVSFRKFFTTKSKNGSTGQCLYHLIEIVLRCTRHSVTVFVIMINVSVLL